MSGLVAASWAIFLAVAVVAPWVPKATAEPQGGVVVVANSFFDNPSPRRAARS